MAAGADIILVDNLPIEEIREAVRRGSRGRAKIELSGRRHARAACRSWPTTGADYVSVGALTHSAPAADISFELEPDDLIRCPRIWPRRSRSTRDARGPFGSRVTYSAWSVRPTIWRRAAAEQGEPEGTLLSPARRRPVAVVSDARGSRRPEAGLYVSVDHPTSAAGAVGHAGRRRRASPRASAPRPVCRCS